MEAKAAWVNRFDASTANGRLATAVEDIHRLLGKSPSGEDIIVTVVRSQSKVDVVVRPAVAP